MSPYFTLFQEGLLQKMLDAVAKGEVGSEREEKSCFHQRDGGLA
jgi:hypothetical protein